MTRIPRGAVRLKWRRQRQDKSRRRPILNLVALMDVFTILVFFFLAHSTDGGPEAHGELVNLPESIAEKPPRAMPIITVTGERILLMGEPVVAIDPANPAWDESMEKLLTALEAQLDRDDAGSGSPELTIMGDRSIPFHLLNRVMQTCNRAGYVDISLTVLQRSRAAG